MIHKEYIKYIKKMKNFERDYKKLAYQSQQNQMKDDTELDSEMREEL